MRSTDSTYHRDGTVTLWDCYRQQWRRLPAAEVTDRILATLPPRERERIQRMAVRASFGGAPSARYDGDRGGATIAVTRDGGATIDLWSRVSGSRTGDRWHLSAAQIAGLEPWQIAAIARERGRCLNRGIVVR